MMVFFIASQNHKARSMRSIQHPGQPIAQRVAAQQVELEPFELELPAHMSLMQAVAQSMQGLGAQCATFRLQGGGFEPFSYVMPALAKTSAHAVYFSDTYPVDGAVRLETASVTFGQRDGKPWLHSHAIWVEASGRRHCGHLLPDDIQVSAPIRALGMAVRGATFVVCPDGETNFTLFVPLKSMTQSGQTTATANATQRPSASNQTPRSKGYALRVAPNVDICTALETFCSQRGITRATIQGGVGSTVGAVFDDGRIVEPFVTELLIRKGEILTDANGHIQAQLDVSMVDYKGGVSEGRLARGQNPVLVTFELALEVQQAQ
jgi:predicted DNA-binding protein with PD1-like motif